MEDIKPIASDLTSWNRLPVGSPGWMQPLAWRDQIARSLRPDSHQSVLPYGNGRTYGDVCLNQNNLLLPTRGLNRIINYDREHGVLTAEAGVTFREILSLIVKDNWFPPVTPGTSHLTLGGAVANDVHGKDHPVAGTFGRHIQELTLYRSDRSEPIRCAPDENSDLFAATIGGLGLTGFIASLRFPLQRIPGPVIETKTQRGNCFEFFAAPAEPGFGHRIAWLDASAPTVELGRGVFTAGRFVAGSGSTAMGETISAPALPSRLLGPWTFRALNRLKYLAPHRADSIVGFEPFFYPLDRIDRWSRTYGRAGFYQHQSLIPRAAGAEPVVALMRAVQEHRQMSFVTVLKEFGDLPSPGLLSFPQAGFSLAMDLPNLGSRTLRLLDALDDIVRAANGRIYPAKDARMSAETFRAGYPQWEAFTRYIDPAFSSGFLRRMSSPSVAAA